MISLLWSKVFVLHETTSIMLINPSLILGLIHNIALLLATSLLIDLFRTQPEVELKYRYKMITGILVGIIGVVLMLTPWELAPGLVFDTRSVLLGIAGLFFGPIPTIIAVVITGAFRLFMGGEGQWMGVAVIISSGGIGLLWRYFRPEWMQKNRYAELYLLGVTIHVAMLLCTLLLPSVSLAFTLKTIALPVLIIYPIGTLLLGLLMYNRYQHWQIKEELYQSEEKFRQLFENSEAIMMLVEPESGSILDVNLAASRFYGYSYDELTSMKIQDINTLEPIEAIDARRRALMSEQTSFVVEHQLSNHEIKTVEVRTSPITFQNKTVLFSIVQDISKRKQAEEALIEAKNRAEESDRLKSTFLATMSHELRTPLNAIIGFSSVMDDETEPAEMKQYAQIINSSGNHLLAIIESIFEVALLQAGEYKIRRSTFRVEELFHALIDFANVEKLKRGKDHLEVIALYPSDAPAPLIETDLGKLTQLMTNLLNNAIKYTPEGRIEFGFTIVDQDITFFVSDTGIGIPDDKIDVVFKKFRQGDEKHTRVHDGVGLGLAICKEIAALLNGKIWVETAENKGTVFYFSLSNAVQPDDPSVKNERKRTQPINLSGKTILIVDDMQDNIHLLERFLVHTKASVLTAGSGEEAITMVMENPGIDLVYMDLKMPGMDGYQATEKLLVIRPDLKVVAQTAHAVTGVRERVLSSGCQGYIAKPIRRDELYQGLREVFGK
jgi:PAS domain S-box-containing protein